MSKFATFNNNLGARITQGVGTMWCAYLFAAIALVSLPGALKSGSTIVIVSWVAQTFLQLVLLSIIMVGQAVSAASVEKKISETHTASLAEFELAKESRAQAESQMRALHDIIDDVHSIMTAVHATVVVNPGA